MWIFVKDWNAIDVNLIFLKKWNKKMKKKELNIKLKKYLSKSNKIQWIEDHFKIETIIQIIFKINLEIKIIISLINSFKIIIEILIENMVMDERTIINKIITITMKISKDQI